MLGFVLASPDSAEPHAIGPALLVRTTAPAMASVLGNCASVIADFQAMTALKLLPLRSAPTIVQAMVDAKRSMDAISVCANPVMKDCPAFLLVEFALETAAERENVFQMDAVPVSLVLTAQLARQLLALVRQTTTALQMASVQMDSATATPDSVDLTAAKRVTLVDLEKLDAMLRRDTVSVSMVHVFAVKANGMVWDVRKGFTTAHLVPSLPQTILLV